MDRQRWEFFVLDGVLTDLKTRGVEDILITVTDNFNGFTDTIKTVFPHSTTPDMCCVSNMQLLQVCGLEGYEGIYGWHEGDIYFRQPGRGGIGIIALRAKVGFKVSTCLAELVSYWDDLTAFFDFPVEMNNYLYDQSDLKISMGKSVNTRKQRWHSLQMMLFASLFG